MSIERVMLNNVVEDIVELRTTETGIDKVRGGGEVGGDVIKIYDKYGFKYPEIMTSFRYLQYTQVETYKSAGISFDGFMYVTGGISEYEQSETVTQQVKVYSDITTDSYTTEQLPFGLYGHIIKELGGKLIILGGYTSDGVLNEDIIERKVGGEWEVVVGVTGYEAKEGMLVHVEGGSMYVIGGKELTGLSSNKVYRSSDGIIWEDVGRIPENSYNNNIYKEAGVYYIFGADTDEGKTGNIYRSDDLINWVKEGVTTFFNERSEYSMVEYEGRYFMLGGKRYNNTTSTIYEISDKLRSINYVGNLSSWNMSNLTVVVDGNKVYIVGGENGYVDNGVYVTEDVINTGLEGTVTYNNIYTYGFYEFILDSIRLNVIKTGEGGMLVDVFNQGEKIITDHDVIAEGKIDIDLEVREVSDLQIVCKMTRGSIEEDVLLSNVGLYYRK